MAKVTASQKSSFLKRAFKRLEKCAICVGNSILKLEFGSEIF